MTASDGFKQRRRAQESASQLFTRSAEVKNLYTTQVRKRRMHVGNPTSSAPKQRTVMYQPRKQLVTGMIELPLLLLLCGSSARR